VGVDRSAVGEVFNATLAFEEDAPHLRLRIFQREVAMAGGRLSEIGDFTGDPEVTQDEVTVKKLLDVTGDVRDGE
jgi:hypothetical protein